MFKITHHPYFIRLFKIINSIADSRICKWGYWLGIGIGCFILIVNIYDVICVLFVDDCEFRVKKITSDKEAMIFILNSIIIFVLPCFISLFARTKHIYRIVGILICIVAAAESKIIFYPNQYHENIAVLIIVILSLCAVISSGILKFNDNQKQSKSETKYLITGLFNLSSLIFLGWVIVPIFYQIYQKIIN